jgi:hypothetical protein
MSLSVQALSAHELVDALLQMPNGERIQTVESLVANFDSREDECRIDFHLLGLWNVAVREGGVYKEDRARILIDQIQHLCGE